MGDKGEGGVKNLKKLAMSFMDSPFAQIFSVRYPPKKRHHAEKWHIWALGN